MEHDEQPAEGNAPARPLGAQLATERERQGLSRADIAQRLHMSLFQVEALESGDYTRLPRGTFLRGFVRNYAKALGLDPDLASRVLDESAPRDPRPGIVVKSQNIRFDPDHRPLDNPYVRAGAVATVLVAIGFFAMYWWFFIKPSPPAVARKAAQESVAANPPAQTPAREAPPAPNLAPTLEEPRAVPQPAAAVALAAQAPTEVAPVIAAGGSIIRFRFRGTAWVEIKDGRGKVLLSRNNPGGSEAEVIGKPPFVVVVGNAPEVQMFYNNREFDLEPHTRVAVARFTVE